MTRNRIAQLDGLRGIAVLMVLVAHWPVSSQRPVFGFGIGGLGVSIFFTLSGFLITRILLYNREKGIGLREFWITRAARIFPLSWAVLIAVGMFAGVNADWWQCLTFSYNMLKDFSAPTHKALGPYWSLCVEEQFYLFWPLVVLFGGVDVARRAAWALIAAGMALLVAMPIIAMFHVEDSAYIGALTYFNSLARFPAIAAGCLLAIHEQQIRQSPRFIIPASVGVAVVALSARHVFMQTAGLIVDPDIAFPTLAVAQGAARTVEQTGIGFLINLAVIVTAFHTRRVVAFLLVPPLQWLGGVSYCVYLIHRPIWWAVGAREPDTGTTLAVAGLLIVLVTAELSRRFFEEPIRRWARQLARQMPSDQPADDKRADDQPAQQQGEPVAR